MPLFLFLGSSIARKTGQNICRGAHGGSNGMKSESAAQICHRPMTATAASCNILAGAGAAATTVVITITTTAATASITGGVANPCD